MGLSSDDPLDLRRLAAHVGVRVFDLNELTRVGMPQESLRHLLGEGSGEFSAALFKRNGMRLTVANPVHSSGRQASNPLEKFRQAVLAATFRGDLTKAWREQHPDVEPASKLLERIRAERRRRWIEGAAEKARANAEAKARKAAKPWSGVDDAVVLEKERAKATKKYKEPEPVDAEGLPELPAGWCWARLEEILVGITAGKSPKARGCPAGPGEFGVLKVSAVSWGEFKPQENKALNGSLPDSVATVSAGDLLISRANTVELVGAVVLVWDDYPNLMLSDKTLRLDVVALFDKEYLQRALRTAPVRAIFEDQATGTSDSMRNLSQPKLKSAPIRIAPGQEQSEIVVRMSDALDVAFGHVERNKELSRALSKLNQSILAKAFRGELVPQDPNDEPASVLLERIRAEREADGASRGKKGKCCSRDRRVVQEVAE